MRRLTTFVFAVTIALTGCGDDQNNGSDNNGTENNGGSASDCSLEMPLSGGVEETLSWGETEGCAGASSGGLITLTFGAFGDQSVQMGLSGIDPGATGMAETYVRYSAGDTEWTAQDCTLDITTNEVAEMDPDFGDSYLLAGTGSCAEAATVTAGDGDEVTIGDFDFSNDQVPDWGE